MRFNFTLQLFSSTNRQFYNFIYKPNAIKKVIKSIIKSILATLNQRKLWSKAVEKSLKKRK